MATLHDPFWASDPKILIKNLDIIPNQQMNNAERLNALTRLLIIITVIMYVTNYEHAFTVFALGLILIILLRYNQQKEHFGPHRGNHDPCHTCGTNSTMAYINTKYETSPENQFSHANYGLTSWMNSKYRVIPVDIPSPARQVWQNEPRYCNEYSQNPNGYNIIPLVQGNQVANNYYANTFVQPDRKTHFNDQEWVENTGNGFCAPGRQSAMPAIQSAFMRDSLEFRNNIMGEYVDQFERSRQHNCVGFKPGRPTW
jgi:hypothetical protein